MTITLDKAIDNISHNKTKAADFIMRISGIKNAAKIISSRFFRGQISQSAVLDYLPTLVNSLEFKKDLNVYKNSSYYSSDNKSYKFANAILWEI